MKRDRLISLALSHARLTLAKDSLHWALSAETADVVDHARVREMMGELKTMADFVWDKMREVQ